MHFLADGTIWQHMFHTGVPIAEKIIRPILVYLFVMLGLRLAGKRELAQLNPFDLIVLLTLSNTVQNAIIGDDNSVLGGFIGAATLLTLNYTIVRLAHKNRRLDRLLEGRPEILMHDGKIEFDALHKEMITKAELVAAAHKQGLCSLHEVDRCVLEPTGTITFVAKKPAPELSRHDEIITLLRRVSDELQQLRAITGSAPGTGK